MRLVFLLALAVSVLAAGCAERASSSDREPPPPGAGPGTSEAAAPDGNGSSEARDKPSPLDLTFEHDYTEDADTERPFEVDDTRAAEVAVSWYGPRKATVPCDATMATYAFVSPEGVETEASTGPQAVPCDGSGGSFDLTLTPGTWSVRFSGRAAAHVVLHLTG